MVLCCIFFHGFLIQFSLRRKIERGTREEGIRRVEEEAKEKKDKCRLKGQSKWEYNVQSMCVRLCWWWWGLGKVESD